MRSFFLNWQDPHTRRWLPVAKLVQTEDFFVFGYTKGAKISPHFLPFGRMNDLDSIYISHDLFPIFANRVMNQKRPEYQRYRQWADLVQDDADSLDLLARIGGNRATDALQVFPVPQPTPSGQFRCVFFSHGLSHLPTLSQEGVAKLQPEQVLMPMLDVQNPFDDNAVCLRTDDPAILVGYCPRYLAPDLKRLSEIAIKDLRIVVRKVNQDAPLQFRLLCEVSSVWPAGFKPCDTEDHQLSKDTNIEELVELVKASQKYQARPSSTLAIL